jgi:hypothetical protein
MFLIVNAASANAIFVASSQLFGELPINSMIFTTAIFKNLQYIICVTIFYFLHRLMRGQQKLLCIWMDTNTQEKSFICAVPDVLTDSIFTYEKQQNDPFNDLT